MKAASRSLGTKIRALEVTWPGLTADGSTYPHDAWLIYGAYGDVSAEHSPYLWSFASASPLVDDSDIQESLA